MFCTHFKESPRSIGRQSRNATQRGAVFVEAVIVITFMVLMWQLMWMVLNHYQARQHGAQQAREDVWQWGMREQCAEDKAPASQDPDADRSPPTDYDEAAGDNIEDPCDSDPSAGTCDSSTDIPGAGEMDGMGGVEEIPEFAQMSETKSNMAIVNVQRSYYSPIWQGNKQVPSQLSIECNPELQDKEGMEGALEGIATRLFSTIKAAL